jgi:hypothetical protein
LVGDVLAVPCEKVVNLMNRGKGDVKCVWEGLLRQKPSGKDASSQARSRIRNQKAWQSSNDLQTTFGKGGLSRLDLIYDDLRYDELKISSPPGPPLNCNLLVCSRDGIPTLTGCCGEIADE